MQAGSLGRARKLGEALKRCQADPAASPAPPRPGARTVGSLPLFAGLEAWDRSRLAEDSPPRRVQACPASRSGRLHLAVAWHTTDGSGPQSPHL